MDRQEPSSAGGSAASGRCGQCGQPLTEREHQVGDACERCEREFLIEYDLDEDGYPRAA